MFLLNVLVRICKESGLKFDNVNVIKIKNWRKGKCIRQWIYLLEQVV